MAGMRQIGALGGWRKADDDEAAVVFLRAKEEAA
jgi:hypothetical protein